MDEKLKNSDGMIGLIFEFEMTFHHMQPPTITPPEHVRFVSVFPNQFNNTLFSYTDLLNTSDVPHCSTSKLFFLKCTLMNEME